MTTVKDYIDCPRCGATKIRADIPMCSECEIDERWLKRYQTEVQQATASPVAADPFADLDRVVDEIRELREPQVSGDLWALADAACTSKTRVKRELNEDWARRLATDLVDADK